MKWLYKTYHLFLLTFLLTGNIMAQDIQLSQYYNAPLIQNPSKTGEKGQLTRFVGNYRSQWSSIAYPYSSGSFSIDKHFKQFGGGLLINHHSAGPRSLEQMNILFSGSYTTKMSESNRMSFGIQAGLLQMRINPDQLSFDEQYSTDRGFESNASTGESFENLNSLNPDFNWGLIWYNGKGVHSRINTSLGIAMMHTFQPNTSLLGSYEPLDRRYTLHGGLHYKVNERFTIKPNFNIMKSNHFYDVLTTIIGSHEFKTHEILSFGIGNRWNDALILYGGMKFTNDLTVGLSYDIHYSNLAPKVLGLASFEISIKFLFNKKKKVTLETENIVDNGQEVDLLKIDTDRDGIPDYMDECPKVYGTIEKNGCPFALHDRDGDGIADKKDKCPDEWGPIRNMGCPQKGKNNNDDILDDRRHENEVSYTELVDLVGPIKIDNIEFATNSAKIDKMYYERLERLYQVLKNNPKYEVLLSGHTDHEGSANYNLMLGENRANAIKDHLTRKGIGRNRVSIVSYGENKPLKENKNKKAMAKNRRTEIIVIKN